MSNDELEFDVGAPTPPAKPQSKPAKQQESVAASEPVQTKKVVKQQESAAEVSAPQPKVEVSKPKENAVEINVPQPKAEVSKPKENAVEINVSQPKAEVSKPKESAVEIKISTPTPKNEPAKQTTAVESEPEDFYIPNTFDKLEAWIRGGKRFKFWLRLKAVCLPPFLLVLIIFIIIYSVSLGGADKKIDRLMSEKEQTTAQLAQDSAKIDELSNDVKKLKADVEYLRKVNNGLKDRLKKQQTAKAAPKPAANQKKK